MRTEREVDEIINDMVKRTKGKYLTQGVAFNKTCPRQMSLLKHALTHSVSFSGLAKEMLALKFSESEITESRIPAQIVIEETYENRDVGNFF